jgi:hypothetical protein
MTTNELIKEQLEKLPTARERKNKNRFIAWLLWKKYNLSNIPIDKETLEAIIVDTSTYDRAWRQVLEHNPSLRGSDYGEKTLLEQEKQVELGYGQ